jgi:hypothetical protein
MVVKAVECDGDLVVRGVDPQALVDVCARRRGYFDEDVLRSPPVHFSLGE